MIQPISYIFMEVSHMAKTQDAKKTDKKKPLKTAKEKKQEKMEKKKNK